MWFYFQEKGRYKGVKKKMIRWNNGKILLDLREKIKFKIQEEYQIPSRKNTTALKQVVVKLLKAKGKEKILKSTREKDTSHTVAKGQMKWLTSCQEQWRPECIRRTHSKCWSKTQIIKNSLSNETILRTWRWNKGSPK